MFVIVLLTENCGILVAWRYVPNVNRGIDVGGKVRVGKKGIHLD